MFVNRIFYILVTIMIIPQNRYPSLIDVPVENSPDHRNSKYFFYEIRNIISKICDKLFETGCSELL